jgi:leader peptidase (prepilin peptidase)/N-methyltransferase
MTILLIVIFTLLGIAIGSFLNVCIDRLPRRFVLYMENREGERLDIEIVEGVFGENPIELFKSKTIYVTGKIIKNKSTGNLQISVTETSQIVVREETAVPEKEKTGKEIVPLSWKEALNRTGTVVTICGKITDGIKVHQSLAYPPSHCDDCQRRLGLLDLIPIFSYLWLRGRCRYCKARIPVRVLLVEVITGLIFFLASWRFILSHHPPEYAAFAITAFWCCVFLVIIFIDWEYKLILNKITYPAAVIALVILAIDSFVPGVNLFPGITFLPHTSFWSGLISGVAVLIPFLLIAAIGSMGMGDVKLVALIGFVSGFPLVVFSMLIGIVLGGLVAIYLLASKKKGRKDVIPYGTFLGIGPIIALIFEHQILNWYLKFF